ncbi:MAG: sulfopyruvate decarboxylase subunit alpha [Nitrospinaceae bacterium]|nr:sulfopyruvate decarboxylase subunit alpha [Nitrospinaceae bacterium]NIR56942.1 sulfopyruvate decarboxylase subunit alpha [Nitrospinaceae bacterium]NIS87398.1 sulfopyruvate decarboxylase subunit alpha [Nitrospinaceae bacterium]NIT84250.1 sulfopyruvate decarboxylase subunit alpha [Nitrospinaceae bacterium]NIU46438.1 sulfopyruvate decarboxylase subunit alpha [Nitrospinaceae bacterium]
MLSSKNFIEKLQGHGFDFFTGVPCSLLSGLIAELESDPRLGYIPSVREDAAVGLCAGAYMGGKQPVVFMQNSGLGYSLNAFTSLNLIYKLPVLVVMSWRGCGGKDAPEHIIMGEVNEQLLETARMDYAVLAEDNTDSVLATALRKIKEEQVPFTLLVKKGLFDERH